MNDNALFEENRRLRGERDEALALVRALRRALEEAVDLMDDTIDGCYKLDVFTVQPVRAALALTPPEALAELTVRIQQSSELAAQIFAYREVLMFYGTGGNYSELVLPDMGKQARAALLRDAPVALEKLEARVRRGVWTQCEEIADKHLEYWKGYSGQISRGHRYAAIQIIAAIKREGGDD